MNFPNRKTISFFLSVLLSIFCLGGTLGCLPAYAAGEKHLSSWDENGKIQDIIDFVEKVTTKGNDYYVKRKDRIAVFDNDGTLWSEVSGEEPPEKWPDYFPIIFEKQNDGFVGSTTDEYIEKARQFVYEENQEDFNVPYIQLVYKPVIGLVKYLKANGFKVYICSGGDIDFVRSFSDKVYGIPPEQVIGTAVKTSFDLKFGGNVKRDTAFLEAIQGHQELAHYNDREGKPVGIQNHIGKRPIIAVGNSSGDLEMFQYTDAGVDKSLIVLINHDDCQREYKYNDVPGATHEECEQNEYEYKSVPDNESLYEAQNRENWIVVSMKNDFNTIFKSNPSRKPPVCPKS